MQSVENKIIKRVYGNGRDWAFFKNDFLDLGSAGAVDQALARKFGWTIQVSGNTALNILGLSTQVRTYFSEKTRERILKDSRYTTAWVYEEIKRIFREDLWKGSQLLTKRNVPNYFWRLLRSPVLKLLMMILRS